MRRLNNIRRAVLGNAGGARNSREGNELRVPPSFPNTSHPTLRKHPLGRLVWIQTDFMKGGIVNPRETPVGVRDVLQQKIVKIWI